MQNCLRKLRQEYNWTQQQLADRIGVTRQTIIFAEKGRYIPSLSLALKLSEIFNMSVNDIFWLDDTDKSKG